MSYKFLLCTANGYTDVITLIQGKLEDVDLPVDSVDFIVSEWMGYGLLYESMLPSVLYARDKYLVDGGVVYPDMAYMYMEALDDTDWYHEKIGFWDNVYGFDMNCMSKRVMNEVIFHDK